MPDAEYGGPAFANEAAISNAEASPQRRTGSRGIVSSLRSMSYEQGREALSPCEGGGGTFLHDLFSRMDEAGDCSIGYQEIVDHLERAGVKGKFPIPGGVVRGKVAESMLEQLGKNKDGQVTWGEFQTMGQNIMPSEIFDDEGGIRTSVLDEVFSEIDTKSDENLTYDEIKKSTLRNLPQDTDNKKIKADVAAKLAIEALDFDQSGGVSKSEFLAAAADVSRVMDQSREGGGGDQ